MRLEDRIQADAVNRALARMRFSGEVRHLAVTESTNSLALQAAHAGQTSGAWVADEQTAGRGRGGHTWHSAPGDGLYVSALFTPKLPATALTLSLAAGLAAWDAIREVSGIVADIRWPNDLVTRTTPSRKLGGILVETAIASARPHELAKLRYVVIGIGINVGHASFPIELATAASSLRIEGWETAQRQSLLIALLEKLDAIVLEMEQAYASAGYAASILSRLAEASTWLHGKRVHVAEDGGYTGTTDGLDAQGFLRIAVDDGTRRTVRSGGVREAE